MILPSLSLRRRLVREMERHTGSLGSLAFYNGVMPGSCDAAADGSKVAAEPLREGFFTGITYGEEPALPEGASYWRVYDNAGAVVMQGDGK